MEQKKASRYCDRSGKWQEGNYTSCHYTNGITRVLHTFIMVSSGARMTIIYCYSYGALFGFTVFISVLQRPINTSNAVTMAHQVRSYTLEAAGFTDSVDVLYVAQLMDKFMEYVVQLREVRVHYNQLLSAFVCPFCNM